MSPALVGLLAAAGHDTLQVRARPRAGLLIFGDELLDSGLPQSGAIRDSLGPQLPGWLAALGIEVVVQRRVEDTAAAHTAAIADALDSCDVIFTTGGTAAGPVDHLHRVIAETGGRLVVDSVACRPGHPMLLAAFESGEGTEPAQRRYLVGLPGNPQSAIVALLTLGAPLVDALLGREMPDLPLVSLTADLRAPRTEDRLVLGQVRSGEFFAVAHLGSGMLRGLAVADGFAIIPPGTVAAGARVPWLPLPQS